MIWYIEHYGVGHLKGGHSGRYQWGSGARPYQGTPMEGKKGNIKGRASSLVPESIRNKISEIKTKNEINKLKKEAIKKEKQENQRKLQEQQAAEKLEQERSEQERIAREAYEREQRKQEEAKAYEKEKQRIINNGTPSEIYALMENPNAFTTQELQAATNRLNALKNYQNLTPKDPTAFEKVSKAMNTLNTVNNWTSTAIKTYNNLAAIYSIGTGKNLKISKLFNKDKDDKEQKTDKKDNKSTKEEKKQDSKQAKADKTKVEKEKAWQNILKSTAERNKREAEQDLKSRLAKSEQAAKKHQEEINKINRSIQTNTTNYQKNVESTFQAWKKATQESINKQKAQQSKLTKIVEGFAGKNLSDAVVDSLVSKKVKEKGSSNLSFSDLMDILDEMEAKGKR